MDQAYQQLQFLLFLEDLLHLDAVIAVHFAHHGVEGAEQRGKLRELRLLAHRDLELPRRDPPRPVHQSRHRPRQPAREQQRGIIKSGHHGQEEKSHQPGDAVHPGKSLGAVLKSHHEKIEAAHRGGRAYIRPVLAVYFKNGPPPENIADLAVLKALESAGQDQGVARGVGEHQPAGGAEALGAQLDKKVPEVDRGKSVIAPAYGVDQAADRHVIDHLELAERGAAFAGGFHELRVPGQVQVAEVPLELGRAAAEHLAPVGAGKSQEQKLRIALQGALEAGLVHIGRVGIPHPLEAARQVLRLPLHHQRAHLRHVLLQARDVLPGPVLEVK